ncbi:MAG: pyruvate dehydrogenase (acetyl-transferring), homodimeric type [Proteobacteria bacterium]|nr:MAG: pyruvate dehydrogenase (acetyl-transferring), homodimeric type [Pseudomonadota bacterium]
MTDLSDISDMTASGHWAVLPPDADPVETKEWLEALAAVIETEGRERAHFLLRKLLDHARAGRVPLPPVLNTPYCNTISLAEQPQFPGNLELEARLVGLVRWNALAMVVRANKISSELGGHIATYASIADLFEVGFNHFFRAGQDGDLVFFQPHATPGVYARAFLEGRLSEQQLENFRREVGGNGLSSYCHPWLMPNFWQFPTGSMGLGPLTAIYQARLLRYLENRGIHETQGRKVWSFVGDGEMDEPESLAGLSFAAREGLDNLIFVVNCNLQRLDGPVRGNGSVIQELEGLFAGAGWHVIKVLWGSDWDPLFARDSENVILKRLHETVDGEFQKYAATDGRFNREHFFNKYPELQALVAHLSDEDIDRLHRGGHDPVKVYAAYHEAVRHRGHPTVILAQTKKGYGMGHWGQGKMASHQQKKLEDEALLAFRDRFALPLSDDDVTNLRFYKPAADSVEMKYLHARRQALGGYLPQRQPKGPSLSVPALSSMSKFLEGTAGREQSTTMVFVQILSQLLRDAKLGRHIAPIVADEARTFGMQALFRQFAIYSSTGQLYEPEDKDELLYYKEAKDGQILEEGISEAGAVASWLAAATSYSTHGVPMLPFYIFYSCFGFQRIGDLMWVAGDSRARGFLLGATAGRTTLSGEGLQHEDGSSHVLYSTVPNCVAYDPCFAFELAVIIQAGMRRMLENQEDVFYYITVMNENYAHPTMPQGAEEGILRGMYKLRPSTANAGDGKRVQLLGSGTILREVLAAAELLENDWKVSADVWSVTSFSELRREGNGFDRHNRLNPLAQPQQTWVEKSLSSTQGPVIAATDYMRTVPDMIRPWVSRRYITLGTDGYGRSDTRERLRRFFEVDRHHVAVAALKALADDGTIDRKLVVQGIEKYGIDAAAPNPWDK